MNPLNSSLEVEFINACWPVWVFAAFRQKFFHSLNIDRVKEAGKRKTEKVNFSHLYSAQSVFQRPMLENDFSNWAAAMETKTEEKPDHCHRANVLIGAELRSARGSAVPWPPRVSLSVNVSAQMKADVLQNPKCTSNDACVCRMLIGWQVCQKSEGESEKQAAVDTFELFSFTSLCLFSWRTNDSTNKSICTSCFCTLTAVSQVISGC